MNYILGIESSCDETAAAVYDLSHRRIVAHHLYSQATEMHEQYGGVVPEIASRSHLEKIDTIIEYTLQQAKISLQEIDVIAVTNKPGLAGSLLVGLCFAKGMAWAQHKKFIGVNHLEGHIFSSFLNPDGSLNENITFPYLCLSVSGGHTSLYLVKDFGVYDELGSTIDDAAGEAFDKIAKLMGHGYPGGPLIEQLAREASFQDFYDYPRGKNKYTSYEFSFSGLKTAILYDMVKRNLYDLKTGINHTTLTREEQQKVASSMLVCINDIFHAKLKTAFNQFPETQGFTIVGGVACNKYLKAQLADYCAKRGKFFAAPPPAFCTDNGAMIAFVGSYKAERGEFDALSLDVFE